MYLLQIKLLIDNPESDDFDIDYVRIIFVKMIWTRINEDVRKHILNKMDQQYSNIS